MSAIRPLLQYRRDRGMSVSHDMVDWIGGFPYEFVSYEVLSSYLELRGFRLQTGTRASSLGCHEVTFVRTAADAPNPDGTA